MVEGQLELSYFNGRFIAKPSYHDDVEGVENMRRFFKLVAWHIVDIFIVEGIHNPI